MRAEWTHHKDHRMSTTLTAVCRQSSGKPPKCPLSDTMQTLVYQAGDQSSKALRLKAARCAQRMKRLQKIRGAKLKENGKS